MGRAEKATNGNFMLPCMAKMENGNVPARMQATNRVISSRQPRGVADPARRAAFRTFFFIDAPGSVTGSVNATRSMAVNASSIDPARMHSQARARAAAFENLGLYPIVGTP
jgi:hypothetical protein